MQIFHTFKILTMASPSRLYLLTLKLPEGELVLIALPNKVQRLTSFVNVLCQLPLRLVNSLTSVRQLQTGVGTRQQKDKELARPTKNGPKSCISCLRQFWPVFVVEL